MEQLSSSVVMDVLIAMAAVFIFVVGAIAAVVTVLFVIDVCQRKDAIRKNFPVLGRFRGILQNFGKYFRQYFFAMDREEMPFNRTQREYVYSTSQNQGSTVGFGSTRDLRSVGSLMFVNCAFPTLDRDAMETSAVTVGPDCVTPYTTHSFYNISAMSYGSISRPATRALSRGAAMAGIWLNTGEGGLAPYHLEGGCDLVFQIGTAKYGMRTIDGKLDEGLLRQVAGHEQVRLFEIKLSQGAKPGKGGILPASKVGSEIARIRNIPVGKASISPNRHEEIDSVSDLLDFIARVRDITGKPVGFKTVVGAYGWLEDLCREIHTRGISSAPDFITVDSADGGSGAAPQVLVDYVGLRVGESLPMVVDILSAWGLRERIRIVASGKLIGPEKIAWALCMGADFVASARGFMFALGCIQAMRCHNNTCPTGVTTHNPRLQRALDPEDKSVRVSNYALNVMRDVEMIARSCGVPEPRRLRRYHARMVTEDGRSQPIDDLYPDAEAGEALRTWLERPRST